MTPEKSYSIFPIDGLSPVGQRHWKDSDDAFKRSSKKPFRFKARKLLNPLSRAARVSNRILQKKKIPFRFCVYLENDEMIFDLVELDSAGKILKETRTNITDESFEKWIYNIDLIEGLMFDRVV